MTVGEILALVAVATNLIAAIVGLTWGVGRIKEQIEDKVLTKFEVAEEKILAKVVSHITGAVMESELKVERVFGEIAAALREKIVQVEFFVRDNYVRQKDFETMVKAIEGRFDRLQETLNRFEEKLDKR